MTTNEMFLKALKKLSKENPEFVSMTEAMSVDELKKEISLRAQQRESVLQAKSEDEQLTELKEQVKELSAPYNESSNALKLKITFLYLLLKQQSGE